MRTQKACARERRALEKVFARDQQDARMGWDGMGWDLDVLRGLETIQLVEQLQHGALHLRVTTY
jgi:hypothetical protein